MSHSVLNALLEAIEYPEKAFEGGSIVLSVDGAEVTAEVVDDRLVLKSVLATGDEMDYGEAAGYAAGRVLREEAVPAYDPQNDALILWQDMAASEDQSVLRRFFETFMTSCDWWRERVRGASERSMIPEMMIRP